MFADPHRLLVFLHLLLFVYWLGSDLGVMINSIYAGKGDLTGNARARLRAAQELIDMAPRTCLVLMVPVGLSLASRWGLAISGAELIAAWVFGFGWLWLVWLVHWRHGTPGGMRLWKIDLGVRIAVTLAFLGVGLSSLLTAAPVAAAWLAWKITLFGVLIALGVIVRLILLWHPPRPAPANADGTGPALPFWTGLRLVVFGIWALVLMMALLGVTKPA